MAVQERYSVVSESVVVGNMGNTALSIAVKHAVAHDADLASLSEKKQSAVASAYKAINDDARKLFDYVKAQKGIKFGGHTLSVNLTDKGRRAVESLAVRQYADSVNQVFASAEVYAKAFCVAFGKCAEWVSPAEAEKITAIAIGSVDGKTKGNQRAISKPVNAMFRQKLGKPEPKLKEVKKDKAQFSAWLVAVNKCKQKGLYTRSEFLEAIKAQLDTVETVKA